MNYKKATLSFDVNGKHHVFTVYHNLESFGLHIESAYINWIHRTKKVTEKSFCNYIMSKDPQIVCMGENDYIDFLNKNKKNE
jgi:hypothetical protein